VADLGVAGRNGVLLAVELRNRAGGVAGRQVELIIKDDEQDPEVAERVTRDLTERVTRDLVAQGVVAIVGPMTSAMAMRVVPVANEAKVLVVSPTVTADDLSGLDDYFFRVIASTRQYASKNALYQRNLRRVATAYDLGNKAYTESWLRNFRDAFSQNGGAIIRTLGFQSGGDTPFLPIASVFADRSRAARGSTRRRVDHR